MSSVGMASNSPAVRRAEGSPFFSGGFDTLQAPGETFHKLPATAEATTGAESRRNLEKESGGVNSNGRWPFLGDPELLLARLPAEVKGPFHGGARRAARPRAGHGLRQASRGEPGRSGTRDRGR